MNALGKKPSAFFATDAFRNNVKGRFKYSVKRTSIKEIFNFFEHDGKNSSLI